MLLGIRTDTGTAQFYLCDQHGNVVHNTTWEADRTLAHLLLKKLTEFVDEAGYTLGDLTGLFVFSGPGSYTGLRIGLTVMNTLAYSLTIPIVGATGDSWVKTAATRLVGGDDDQVVLPDYGGEVHITRPVK